MEYGGKWKGLHYQIKRSFNSVLISGYEDKAEGAIKVFLTG